MLSIIIKVAHHDIHFYFDVLVFFSVTTLKTVNHGFTTLMVFVVKALLLKIAITAAVTTLLATDS